MNLDLLHTQTFCFLLNNHDNLILLASGWLRDI